MARNSKITKQILINLSNNRTCLSGIFEMNCRSVCPLSSNCFPDHFRGDPVKMARRAYVELIQAEAKLKFIEELGKSDNESLD